MKTNNLYKQRRGNRARDLLATYRSLGMSDEEILAEMKKLQAAKVQRSTKEAKNET